jgi:hypothetical protein
MSDALLPAQTKIKVGRTAYLLTDDAAAQLQADSTAPKKTYLLKAACEAGCGYTVRVTAKWAFKALPDCPCCSDAKTGFRVPLVLATNGEGA